MPLRHEIAASEPAAPGAALSVTMHDGSVVRFRSTDEGYDATDRDAAWTHVRRLQSQGEIATGLLHIDESGADMHALNRTVATPLAELPHDRLCPGAAALDALQAEYR